MTVYFSGQVAVGTSRQLTAYVPLVNPAIVWSVNGAPGGQQQPGHHQRQTLYGAPTQVPTAGDVKVSATSTQAANRVRRDLVALIVLLVGAGPARLATSFPGTSIGQQSPQAARIIRLRAITGLARQVFLCSIGGVDTHSAQSWVQMDLLQMVGNATAAFHATTIELHVADGVRTFTASEFGRTPQPGGSGSDHGWGSHPPGDGRCC